MSQLPFMYGHFPGQQEQQPPNHQPFNYQTTPNPPPSFIGTPQQTLTFAGNHTVTNISYEQNANRIPGLAFGLSPPFPTPSYRPEINSSWPQIPSTTPPTHIPSHIPSQAQAAPSFRPQGSDRPHEHPIQAQPRPTPLPLQQPLNNTSEEGELSEGEFEDLYEPREAGGTTQAQQRSPPLRAYGFSENHVSSASDADGSSLYNIGSPREEPVVESTSASMLLVDDEYSPEDNRPPVAPQRERSGSYSPYLSPSELQRRASVTQATTKDSKIVQSIAQPNSTVPRKPSQAAPRGNHVHAVPASNKASPSTNAMDSANRKSSFHSVSEAKKKAQEAILGLWPLKIRYQNYVDEGFDEDLIKSLFTDLGLDVSTSKPNISTNKHSGESRIAEEISAKSTQPPKPNLPQSNLDNKAVPSSSANVNEVKMVDKPTKSAAEERKDKIARKLAAKAQKTATVGSTPSAKPLPSASSLPSAPSLPAVATGTGSTAINLNSSTAIDSPAPAGPPPTKTKTRAENNALLHQKLAALKKKEQEKAAVAQASAGKQSTTPIQTTTTMPAQPLIVRTNSSVAASINQPKHSSSASSPQPTSMTADYSRRSVSAQPQPQPQPQLPSISKDALISGLSLPAVQSTQTKPRSLKRPVASDFDNYSTQSNMLKRTRTQETLIIDVSDDEDVEMDIGSPTDGPATSIQTANPPGRQTPLAAFPPLSDPSAWKQRSSPASSAAQVPEKPGKLDFLHGRIEEMKKKIAEAEAKKKSTIQSSASQTPSTQSPPAAESLRLPKASDSKEPVRKVGSERRNRIASVDLPALEATLKEKRDRLREIVSQAAQLELDLQAAEAEKQQLANEMKQLGDTSEGDSAESSRQSPALVSSASANETQTPGSLGETPSLVEPQGLAQGAAITAPSFNHEVAMVNSGVTSSRSDTDMDISKPQSPSDQTMVIHEPSESHSQSDTPAQTDVAPINGITEGSSESTYPVGNEHYAREEVDAPKPRSSDDESHDSADADISMQTSPAESSSSDDESYEPQLAQISDIQGALFNNGNVLTNSPEQGVSSATNELKDEQIIDKDPFEPSPVQTDVQAIQSGLKDTNGEVEEKPISPVKDPLSYRSPFEYFRAYRFHPRFLRAVPGGLKSMTYSSKIDPNKEICPHALSGAQCPDGNACAYQHFENMVVPDGEIITQLGSSDMFSGEVKLRFIEGLKKVLNGLKANKVRDFDRITKAIVEYRAAFSEDKTKVLPLDGVTI